MSAARSALVFGLGAILAACTFTRSLDYLTDGPAGVPDAGTSSTSSTTSSSGQPIGGEGGVPVGSILASDQGGPRNLTQDGDSVYWTNDAKKVMRVAKAGGPVQEVAALPAAARGLAVDPSPNGNVFVLVGGAVKTAPKAGGGALEDFGTIANALLIAADESFVFIATQMQPDLNVQIARYPKGNPAAASPISSATESEVTALVLFGDKVFWSSFTADGTYVLNEQSKSATAAVAPLVHQNGALEGGEEIGVAMLEPWQLAIDETAIYWVDDSYSRPLRLLRTPLKGDAQLILSSATVVPTAVGVDAQYIYLADEGDADSRIVRVPKNGGAPDELVAAANPKAVITDANAIYVAFNGIGGLKPAGGIQRIPTK